MSGAEQQLFAAWHELALAGEAPPAPPVAMMPRLLAILETLLRIHDFDTFELLLALWERLPLPERERRELLAELYLRCGFAASAAEEWIAVCRESSDVRALLGLARVAVARGMREQADDFASAALAQDPGNQEVVSLISEMHSRAA